MGHILAHPSSELPRGTTNETIAADLRASLTARTGVKAAGTVGDFIAALRQLGVTDDMPLAFIEFGVKRFGNGFINIDAAEDGIEIREGN